MSITDRIAQAACEEHAYWDHLVGTDDDICANCGLPWGDDIVWDEGAPAPCGRTIRRGRAVQLFRDRTKVWCE